MSVFFSTLTLVEKSATTAAARASPRPPPRLAPLSFTHAHLCTLAERGPRRPSLPPSPLNVAPRRLAAATPHTCLLRARRQFSRSTVSVRGWLRLGKGQFDGRDQPHPSSPNPAPSSKPTCPPCAPPTPTSTSPSRPGRGTTPFCAATTPTATTACSVCAGRTRGQSRRPRTRSSPVSGAKPRCGCPRGGMCPRCGGRAGRRWGCRAGGGWRGVGDPREKKNAFDPRCGRGFRLPPPHRPTPVASV